MHKQVRPAANDQSHADQHAEAATATAQAPKTLTAKEAFSDFDFFTQERSPATFPTTTATDAAGTARAAPYSGSAAPNSAVDPFGSQAFAVTAVTPPTAKPAAAASMTAVMDDPFAAAFGGARGISSSDASTMPAAVLRAGGDKNDDTADDPFAVASGAGGLPSGAPNTPANTSASALASAVFDPFHASAAAGMRPGAPPDAASSDPFVAQPSSSGM